MSKKNKEIVRKYYEQANNDRDLTVFERYVAENIVVHFVPEIRGREKLRQGICKACACSPLLTEQIERLVRRVETKVRRTRRGEISSRAIGDMVMKELVEVDNVAYVLFASVYLPLTNLGDIGDEIERLLNQR